MADALIMRRLEELRGLIQTPKKEVVLEAKKEVVPELYVDVMSFDAVKKLYLKKQLREKVARYVRLKSDKSVIVRVNLMNTNEYKHYQEDLLPGQPLKIKLPLDDIELEPLVAGETVLVDVFACTSAEVDVETEPTLVGTPSANVPRKMSLTTVESSISFGTRVRGFYVLSVSDDCFLDFDRSVDANSPLVPAGSGGLLEYKCTKVYGKTSTGTSTVYLVGVY